MENGYSSTLEDEKLFTGTVCKALSAAMRLTSRVLGAESVTLFCSCVGDGGGENSGGTSINGVLLGAELWNLAWARGNMEEYHQSQAHLSYLKKR